MENERNENFDNQLLFMKYILSKENIEYKEEVINDITVLYFDDTEGTCFDKSGKIICGITGKSLREDPKLDYRRNPPNENPVSTFKPTFKKFLSKKFKSMKPFFDKINFLW